MSEDHLQQHLLCVPVRDTACGFALRMFRNRDGSRCAAAFTSEARLTAVLGVDQRWVALSEVALRGLTEPLGVQDLFVDPNMVAPSVTTAPVTTAPATTVTTAPRPSAHRPHRQPAFSLPRV